MRVCCGFGCPVLARLLFRCSCSSPHRVTTAQAAEWSQWHWQQAWACTAMRIERNGRIAHCLKSEYSKRIPLAGKVGPVEPSGKNFEPVVWLLLKASWSSYELWPSPAPCCVGVKLWLLLDSKPTAIILYGYPQIIHFRREFSIISIINHPFWGIPIYGNPAYIYASVNIRMRYVQVHLFAFATELRVKTCCTSAIFKKWANRRLEPIGFMVCLKWGIPNSWMVKKIENPTQWMHIYEIQFSSKLRNSGDLLQVAGTLAPRKVRFGLTELFSLASESQVWVYGSNEKNADRCLKRNWSRSWIMSTPD